MDGVKACVNQDGEGKYNFDVNTLNRISLMKVTKFQFAASLTREYEEDTGHPVWCFGKTFFCKYLCQTA